jgi:hypothetical protein
MGGAFIPLDIADIRRESERTSDPDAIADRVMLIDNEYLKAWVESKKKEKK